MSKYHLWLYLNKSTIEVANTLNIITIIKIHLYSITEHIATCGYIPKEVSISRGLKQRIVICVWLKKDCINTLPSVPKS